MPLADVPDRQLDERDGLMLAQVEHIGDRLDDQRRIVHTRQFYEPDTVIVRAQLGSGGLDRQPGLSGTAGTGQRECATARQEPFDVTHLALATNEAAELDGQVVPSRRSVGRSVDSGVLGGRPPRAVAARFAIVRAVGARRPSSIWRYSCWLSSDGSTPSSRPRTERNRSYWRRANRR